MLRALHQAVVRSNDESGIAAIASLTLDRPYSRQHETVRFSFADVLFVGPAAEATSYHTFSADVIGRVRAVPRLDVTAPFEAQGGLAVGNYLFTVETEGELPDGLRHGGFWAIPCGSIRPEVISSSQGMLLAGVSFFVADNCVLVLQDPRKLFPDGLIGVETGTYPRRHLLHAAWGDAGLAGARWQQDASAASFARGLMLAAGLTPGGVVVNTCVELGHDFCCLLENDTLVRSPAFVSAGPVHPFACVEGVARVLFPAPGIWWRATRWEAGYRPFPALEVTVPDANVLWTITGTLSSGAARIRATLQGSPSEQARFWQLADAQQVATGVNWAALLGVAGEGQSVVRNGLDFFLATLDCAANVIAVEVSTSVTSAQVDAMSDFLRLHMALGRRAVFTRPL